MTTEELRTIRNALMECWTPIELAFVLERNAKTILRDKNMRQCLVSTINRINTLQNVKEDELRNSEKTLVG